MAYCTSNWKILTNNYKLITSVKTLNKIWHVLITRLIIKDILVISSIFIFILFLLILLRKTADSAAHLVHFKDVLVNLKLLVHCTVYKCYKEMNHKSSLMLVTFVNQNHYSTITIKPTKYSHHQNSSRQKEWKGQLLQS